MAPDKIRWKWVRIPEEVWRSIRDQARRENIAIWKVLQRAWSYWVSASRSHHIDVANIDKLAWYVYKVSASVGEFRARPTEENLKWIENNAKILKDRYGIEADKLVLAARQYMKRPTKKSRMVLNDAAKEVIIQIIMTLGERR
ncbi:MAG: hypothetical protein DRJ67_01055 [Thermoprotei archaeon]|nr:MAG: hypothetical protein DRJ67_01055 [Thermoprotei archaeon]